MLDPDHPIAKLLREDRRYTFDAYVFVFEALRYAQEELGMGSDVASEGEVEGGEAESEEGKASPRHLTGQELCEAIRQYALEQYGLMAKCVLNQWGVQKTGDFGEIVFNLIHIGEMRKTPHDRREDFDDVFDFEAGLTGKFRITLPE
ncbi:MAG: hypothetical protein KDA42_00610 [Planctomycetales bacterium]|nr:hypothetical protein [Planctomycetales bacterium]